MYESNTFMYIWPIFSPSKDAKGIFVLPLPTTVTDFAFPTKYAAISIPWNKSFAVAKVVTHDKIKNHNKGDMFEHSIILQG